VLNELLIAPAQVIELLGERKEGGEPLIVGFDVAQPDELIKKRIMIKEIGDPIFAIALEELIPGFPDRTK
jgi:hypothetical protein